MSYRLLKVSELSAIPTGYSLSATDLIQATVGTGGSPWSPATVSLSSIKVTLGDYASFLNSTNNTEAMWVSSGNDAYNKNSGNVGVGDNSPDHKLAVAGSGAFTGSISAVAATTDNFFGGKVHIGTPTEVAGTDSLFEVVSSGSTSQGTGMRVVDTAAAGSQFIAFSNLADSKDKDAYIQHFNSSGSLPNDLKIYNEAAIRFHDDGSATNTLILTGGNLGIGTGTTPPTRDVEIGNGTGSPTLGLNKSTGGTATLYFDNAGAQKCWIQEGPEEQLRFATGDDTKVTILESGNVGIGSTAPDEKLHVEGEVLFSTNSTAADSGRTLSFHSTTSNPNAAAAHAGIKGGRIDANNGYLSLLTRDNASTAERVRIDHDGKVGIGTTDPGTTLDVTGTDAITIPKGTTAQRPSAETGQIRYNTSTNQFEGYHTAGWNSLGGIRDIDGDTYITTEVTTDDDTLHFYVGVSNSAELQIQLENGALFPDTTNDVSLGKSGYNWSNIWTENINSTNATVTDITVNGTATLKSPLNVYEDTAATYGIIEVGGPGGGYVDLKTPTSDDFDLRIIHNGADSKILAGGDPTSVDLILGTYDFNGAGTDVAHHFLTLNSSNKTLDTARQIVSTFAGAPFSVANSTVVTNLNADKVDGLDKGNIGSKLYYDSNTLYLRDNDNNNISNVTISTGNPFNQTLNTTNSVQFKSLGVNTSAPTTDGRIHATDDVIFYYSDRRLKKDITHILDPLDKVLSLNGFTYRANEQAMKFGFSDEHVRVGVFADEVESVLPEAVKSAPFDTFYDDDDNEHSVSGENYKTVQYEKLVPLLIEAIKELNEKVERLEGGK